eukprot:GCRY01001729.1.p1 GENE.GCRY01001729.1~~GCRY01001729.1.p1  ORF type:complete len:184 (+),score=15.82 GCRY01001729.1:198-749(+)
MMQDSLDSWAVERTGKKMIQSPQKRAVSPFDIDSKCSFYANEKERFGRGGHSTAELLRDIEKDKKTHKRALLEEKRLRMSIRETHYKEKQFEDELKDKQRIESKRNFLQQHSANTVTPWNPISREYADSKEGKLLQYHDSCHEHRQSLRASRLYNLNNCGYNPINGRDLLQPTITPEPNPPRV